LNDIMKSFKIDEEILKIFLDNMVVNKEILNIMKTKDTIGRIKLPVNYMEFIKEELTNLTNKLSNLHISELTVRIKMKVLVKTLYFIILKSLQEFNNLPSKEAVISSFRKYQYQFLSYHLRPEEKAREEVIPFMNRQAPGLIPFITTQLENLREIQLKNFHPKRRGLNDTNNYEEAFQKC
jgi:hypothetical protein